MKKLMNVLLLSCKKATELIEKRTVVGLSMKEKLQLKIHIRMCSACRAYENQSKTMDKAVQQFTNKNKQMPASLSYEAKVRIIQNLEKK
jgi:hypothetical protein